jgi:hypothetical protein
MARMTDHDDEPRVAELDRLLNDPAVRLYPHRVWALLAELRLLMLAGAAGGRITAPGSPSASAGSP